MKSITKPGNVRFQNEENATLQSVWLNMPLLTPIVANMEVEGPLGSDLSFNKKSEVSLIYDLQVLV